MKQSTNTLQSERVMRVVLLLAAAHSFATGLGLIFQPEVVILWGGWGNICENFFPAQGGVFHVLMAGLYLQAIGDRSREVLLPFIILVKTTAMVFLFTYVVAVKFIWMAAASGVVDGGFALVLYIMYRNMRHGHEDS